MNVIVLDSGAFIASERWSQKLRAWLAYATEENATVIIPSAVIAEIWRDPPRMGSVRLLHDANTVASLTLERAKALGQLLGEAGTAQIVDASVATLAIENRPCTVLTSEPDDILTLLNAAGISCAIGTDRQADVVLIEI